MKHLIALVALIAMLSMKSQAYNDDDVKHLHEISHHRSYHYPPIEMRQLNLRGAPLEGLCLRGILFHETAFQGANFSHCDLQGAFFDHSNMTQVNFTGANLQDACFTQVNLSDVCLAQATLSRASFHQCQFSPTLLIGSAYASLIVNGQALNEPFIPFNALKQRGPKKLEQPYIQDFKGQRAYYQGFITKKNRLLPILYEWYGQIIFPEKLGSLSDIMAPIVEFFEDQIKENRIAFFTGDKERLALQNVMLDFSKVKTVYYSKEWRPFDQYLLKEARELIYNRLIRHTKVNRLMDKVIISPLPMSLLVIVHNLQAGTIERQGKVISQLDLHGKTPLEIKYRKIHDFIKRVHAKRHKKAVIITGRGLHNPEGKMGVLWNLCNQYLSTRAVSKYIRERHSISKNGAWKLYLRQKEPRRIKKIKQFQQAGWQTNGVFSSVDSKVGLMPRRNIPQIKASIPKAKSIEPKSSKKNTSKKNKGQKKQKDQNVDFLMHYSGYATGGIQRRRN